MVQSEPPATLAATVRPRPDGGHLLAVAADAVALALNAFTARALGNRAGFVGPPLGAGRAMTDDVHGTATARTGSGVNPRTLSPHPAPVSVGRTTVAAGDGRLSRDRGRGLRGELRVAGAGTRQKPAPGGSAVTGPRAQNPGASPAEPAERQPRELAPDLAPPLGCGTARILQEYLDAIDAADGGPAAVATGGPNPPAVPAATAERRTKPATPPAWTRRIAAAARNAGVAVATGQASAIALHTPTPGGHPLDGLSSRSRAAVLPASR